MKLSREVKTGIIAILVIAIGIWGFNFLKGKNIISPTDIFYVEYSQIDGLIESGAVYYRGYKVGSINRIDFNSETPDRFIVKIVLEKDIKIPLKSKVMAKSSNPIAGAKDLQIIFYDTTAYHMPGDTLLPAYDKGIMGILEPLQNQFDETILGINQTLLALNNILDTGTQENIQASIESVKEISNSLSILLAPNGDLAQTMRNLESVTLTIESKKEEIGTTVDNMASISSSLDSADIGKTIRSLDSTLMATQSILTKINEGEGTAGLLVNDSSLYMNLTASTASLDSLLTDLKEHPKRYVHFSMFGKKDK